MHAGKDVENRPLSVIKRMQKHFGETIFIHAGKFYHPDYFAYAEEWLASMADVQCPSADKLEYGGIVGTAKLVGMVEGDGYYRLTEPYGIELADARPCRFTPCKGQLGLFTPNIGK